MTVILVCAALAGFALLYTLWVPREEVYIPQPPTRLDHLREKKKTLYDNLKDLHFEYRTGKLSDEDYQQLKSSLQYQLAQVMKNIEELEAHPEAGGKGKPARAAAPTATRSTREAPVCPSCSHPNAAHHKHCSECGAPLRMLVAMLLLAGVSTAALPAIARQVAVEGLVRNGTTSQPATGLAVTLIRAGEAKEPLGQAATDARGRFRFPAVEPPAPPAMLLVQAEHDGVRYAEPVVGIMPVEITIYEAGARASAIRVTERQVILHPTRGKLLVIEFYRLQNESDPPATYAPEASTFRFFAPEGGSGSLQVSARGAAGMSIPLEPRVDAGAPGVLAVRHPLKPGENRIEVSYHLDYPGSLVFESRAAEKVERTRLAVPEGVTAEGEGLRFLGSEPQTRFRIYNVARNDRWTLRLAGEGRLAAAGASGATGEGGAAENDSDIISRPGPVGERRAEWLAAVLVVLGAGFVRLWRQARPVTLPSRAARNGPPSRKRRS